jgi:hypothetical protein
MPDLLNFPLAVLVVSFLPLWGSARLGYRFRSRVDKIRDDFSIVQGATFTLLGLIVGFSFSMSVSRYDQRKVLEEEEANAIGTEYVRAELLPAADSENVKQLLRAYTDQRVLFYDIRDEEQLSQIDASTTQLQTRLWASVRNPALAQPTVLTSLASSGMNDVINSQGYTLAAWRNRIPAGAWLLMGVIALCANFMIGLNLHQVASRSPLIIVFPALIAVSFFLISDIDSPHGGLIHVRPVNLIDTVRSMHP